MGLFPCQGRHWILIEDDLDHVSDAPPDWTRAAVIGAS